ncbi:RagB/SusD family nutrient uptake outer membrane protein [Sphingobacterium faecale]|uniref:RagB/SusD family nutrient uptake outer membrane protein n=1 Tax=Sphingobacterium faecale TaxID=2803775 RepID=A0ABS1R2X7_9SPHI|nr:RagB/SusD family nutrient uptake outer membrane protein [Sphingobacterium faecale]MBL1409066.1 RagB/SusD family nutrient uptake outer membrane protein [Sphingobacterium faecale]
MKNIIISITLLFFVVACKEDYLKEDPLSNLSAEKILTTPNGFNLYLTGLYVASREEMSMGDNTYFALNFASTDIGADAGVEYTGLRNYETTYTPNNTNLNLLWNWAYTQMILRANTLITYANKNGTSVWTDEKEKNKVIAVAKFFRAYTYNLLVNSFGGVPLVEEIYSTPKNDFKRATKEEILNFAKEDLLFAIQWLPTIAEEKTDGKITKGAAQHLLTEVYLGLGDNTSAISSASDLIGSGMYKIMTTRFGGKSTEAGDVFSDLFLDGNANRSSGNQESIFVWQFENMVNGGGSSLNGNVQIRNWAPFLSKIVDPDGKPMLVVDSLGRGVGRVRGTNYFLYDIWKPAPNDMRNSSYNMRRKFYYNNPSSKYFNTLVEKKTVYDDTMRNIYPYSRKIEGAPWANNATSGRSAKDVIVYRLAETYLLRAEAYLKAGRKDLSVLDINVLRSRAGIAPINEGEVTIDFLLDERARELTVEEPRRRVLVRLGVLVDRVKKYNLLEETRSSIQPYHLLFPIPQAAIDANYGYKLDQNTGY